MCMYVGIADLLAALRTSQKRFQDAGRGPGSAAHPTGGLQVFNMCTYARQDHTMLLQLQVRC